MFTFWPGFISFIVALFSGYFIEIHKQLPSQIVYLFSCFFIEIHERLPSIFVRFIAGIGIMISLYSVINGIYHFLVTWEFIDLFSTAQEQNVRIGIKRGFALLLIQFWPFAAIAIGGMGVLLYWQAFRLSKYMD